MLIRKVIASVFFLAFFVQAFSNLLIITSYYSNRAAYAKNCINKARPKMHCNGKCQMMKKLQEEEKKDSQAPERKSEYKADVLSSRSFFCTQLNTHLISTKIYGYGISGDITAMPRSFFHPPDFIA